jgi:hypothetical protein
MKRRSEKVCAISLAAVFSTSATSTATASDLESNVKDTVEIKADAERYSFFTTGLSQFDNKLGPADSSLISDLMTEIGFGMGIRHQLNQDWKFSSTSMSVCL